MSESITEAGQESAELLLHNDNIAIVALSLFILLLLVAIITLWVAWGLSLIHI